MCLHGTLSSIPFNLICNMTTFSIQIFDLLTSPQVSKCFDLLTPSGLRVCVRTEYVLDWCFVFQALDLSPRLRGLGMG